LGYLLDQSVGAQALDQVRGPAGRKAGDRLAQIAGAEAGDGPLAAGEGQELVDMIETSSKEKEPRLN